ncbi:hypothetical protein [Parashewanella curva]|nr:hypothetical protein [Parashewanella curva]
MRLYQNRFDQLFECITIEQASTFLLQVDCATVKPILQRLPHEQISLIFDSLYVKEEKKNHIKVAELFQLLLDEQKTDVLKQAECSTMPSWCVCDVFVKKNYSHFKHALAKGNTRYLSELPRDTFGWILEQLITSKDIVLFSKCIQVPRKDELTPIFPLSAFGHFKEIYDYMRQDEPNSQYVLIPCLTRLGEEPMVAKVREFSNDEKSAQLAFLPNSIKCGLLKHNEVFSQYGIALLHLVETDSFFCNVDTNLLKLIYPRLSAFAKEKLYQTVSTETLVEFLKYNKTELVKEDFNKFLFSPKLQPVTIHLVKVLPEADFMALINLCSVQPLVESEEFNSLLPSDFCERQIVKLNLDSITRMTLFDGLTEYKQLATAKNFKVAIATCYEHYEHNKQQDLLKDLLTMCTKLPVCKQIECASDWLNYSSFERTSEVFSSLFCRYISPLETSVKKDIILKNADGILTLLRKPNKQHKTLMQHLETLKDEIDFTKMSDRNGSVADLLATPKQTHPSS